MIFNSLGIQLARNLLSKQQHESNLRRLWEDFWCTNFDLKPLRVGVEKYSDVDRDENHHAFLRTSIPSY